MKSRQTFSPAQCRAGRALLRWTPERLAAGARLEVEAVELYESGEGQLAESELVLLGGAFSAAGVIALAERLAGEGVRFRQPLERLSFAGRDLGDEGFEESAHSRPGENAADQNGTHCPRWKD